MKSALSTSRPFPTSRLALETSTSKTSNVLGAMFTLGRHARTSAVLRPDEAARIRNPRHINRLFQLGGNLLRKLFGPIQRSCPIVSRVLAALEVVLL